MIAKCAVEIWHWLRRLSASSQAFPMPSLGNAPLSLARTDSTLPSMLGGWRSYICRRFWFFACVRVSCGSVEPALALRLSVTICAFAEGTSAVPVTGNMFSLRSVLNSTYSPLMILCLSLDVMGGSVGGGVACCLGSINFIVWGGWYAA